MRTLTAAAALALAVTAPVSATPPVITSNPTTCVTTAGTPSCRFQCAGPGTIRISVYGGAVQGNATCGFDRARCTGTGTCSGSDFTTSNALGWCDLTTGVMAVCSWG